MENIEKALLQTVRTNLEAIQRDCGERDKIYAESESALFALEQYEKRAEPENNPLTCDGCVQGGARCYECRRLAPDYYTDKPKGAQR